MVMTQPRFFGSLLLAGVFIAVVPGCTSDEKGDGEEATAECPIPGQTRACECPDGTYSGQQTCLPDRTVSNCVCAAFGAGGTGFAGGSVTGGAGSAGVTGGAGGSGGTQPAATGGSTVEPVTCGNGVVDPGEDCEGAVPIAATCESLGLGTGPVTCDATCHFDTSGCVSNANLFTVNYEISSAIGTVGIVTWSTTLAPVTEAYIEFGLDTNYGMVAPVDLNEPQYRTLLLGMKGSRDYHFRVVAISGGTEHRSNDYVLTTGPVTNLVRTTDLTVDNEAARERGFIVTSLYQTSMGGGFFPGGGSGALAFIVDADGDIVWWHSPSLSSTTRARMSYDGKHMWMVTAGLDRSNGVERVSMDGLDAQMFTTAVTHDITPVTGNVMAYLAGGFTGCVTITDITPDGTMTPVFDTSQFFAGNNCHANALRYSETEGVYTLSDLTQGDVLMVDRATRTVVNRLSDFSFNWGGHQHGHHLLNDSIVIFNNGDRIVQEISLNRANMQSSEIWRYGSTYGSEVLGDAQRLPNGNTLVTYSTAATIHEVAPNSTRVMEIRFSQSTGYSVWRESLYGPPPDVVL